MQRIPKTFNEVLEQVDERIRHGSIAEAARMLRKLSPKNIPEMSIPSYASLCRRAGLYYRGIQAFQNLFEVRRFEDVPPRSRAEYAVLLQRRGVVREALAILDEISEEEVPEVLLYKSFCLFNAWRYGDAIPLLEKYVSMKLPAYQRTVGEVNLCAASLNHGALSGIGDRLDRLIEETSSSGHNRLLANCHELKAHLAVENGDYESADIFLKKAEVSLDYSGIHDTLFVKKWKAIVEGLKTGDVEPLRLFRKSRAGAVEFETLRVLDLYELKIRFDRPLFMHLFFGTQSAGFRDRIVAVTGHEPDVDSHVFGGGPGGRVLDLTDKDQVEDADLGFASNTHNLMKVFLTDFYQPFRVGRIFSELFPDEKFMMSSSPARVRMVISRAQEFVMDLGIGGSLVSTKQGYALRSSPKVGFRVPLHWGDHGENREKLIVVFLESREESSMSEICAATGFSKSVAAELIKRAISSGKVAKFGGGKKTRYFLARRS